MSPTLTLIGIAVVECQGRFLVGTRSGRSALAGLAEFPGGKVEPGETPVAAAVRECLEETGVAVAPVRAYETHVETYPHGTVELHFIACRPVACGPCWDQPMASHSCVVPQPPFRWVARAALMSLDFPAGNRNLLATLVD